MMIFKKTLAMMLTGTLLFSSASMGVNGEDYFTEESTVYDEDNVYIAPLEDEEEWLDEAVDAYGDEYFTEESFEEFEIESISEFDMVEEGEEVDEGIPDENAPQDEFFEEFTIEETYDAAESQPSSYEEYISTAFAGDSSLPKNKRGSRLTGFNRALYEALSSYISEVAEGKRTSTEFVFESDFFGPALTASDLGLPYTIDASGNINPDLPDKMLTYYNISIETILSALGYDLPYDLYWFNKTIGVEAGAGVNASTDGRGNDKANISKYTVSFYVSQEFRASSSDPYTVNSKYGSTVTKAVNNAKAIVQKYSNASDYEKLDGYRAEICKAVSYNTAAANTNNNVPYGNPWQLLYVFDGDASTNVVCEGYTKAFQWLCDQTEFQNASISSVMVTGFTNNGLGSGGHMWNLVTMEDGKNYLVDITNCDEGTIGAGRGLFLTGSTLKSGANGYTLSINDQDITYLYDNATAAAYDASELSLSSGYYKQVQQIVVNPTPSPASVTPTPAVSKKKANPLTVKAKSPSIKASKLKKKAQTIAAAKALTVSGAQGAVSYKKVGGAKKLSISTDGKITVKKGTKKGNYKLNVAVTAAGNGQYEAKTVKVTVTIKVK